MVDQNFLSTQNKSSTIILDNIFFQLNQRILLLWAREIIPTLHVFDLGSISAPHMDFQSAAMSDY